LLKRVEVGEQEVRVVYKVNPFPFAHGPDPRGDRGRFQDRVRRPAATSWRRPGRATACGTPSDGPGGPSGGNRPTPTTAELDPESPSPPGTGRISCPPRAALLNRRALHFSGSSAELVQVGYAGLDSADGSSEWISRRGGRGRGAGRSGPDRIPHA
jgi:hypothetical protein